MMVIRATHRRAGRRRAAAWRLCVILILGAAVTAGFAPRAARAASLTPYSDLGGGCFTGDPDDGEHVVSPGLPPVAGVSPGSPGSPGSLGDHTAASRSRYSVRAASSSETLLLPSDGSAFMRALIRSVRPLAWLAMSARQPWACESLWLVMAATADPTAAPMARPLTVSDRTR